MKKTKSMTPKQVQNKLNALCEGLGDAWMENYITSRYSKQHRMSTLNFAIGAGFVWDRTEQGCNFWSDISSMILEMEQAELI